ncbi:CAMK/DAPK/DAPK protein kinase, partial [Aphelenchoides avenae]
MHVSAGAGFEQMVVFLQRHGSVLDVEDRRGDTPLFWAARNGHAHLVRYFVDAKNVKVNVNHVNKNKETALHVATRYTQVESVLALLENSANVDVQDEHGETALHIASWHGYAMLLSILCRFGPSLDLLNK